MKRMKILFYLTRYPGLGGIENVTSMILSKLCQVYDCSVISHLQAPSPMPLPDGIDIYKMPDCKRWQSLQNQLFFERLIIAGSFDIVIYQDSYAPTEKIVLSVCQNFSVPVIVFEHSSPLYVENKLHLSKWYSSLKSCLRHILQPLLRKRERERKRRLIESSARYVVLSERFVPELETIAGISRGQHCISAIHNPLSDRTLVLQDNTNREILYVGRLVREKRVELVIKIWKLIFDKLPDWKLTIVGDGPEWWRLGILAKNLPRISFEGFKAPAPYYQRASMFIMTSKFEGWGMTIVEAMQYGCVPVVVNSFSSLADIIDDGKNGLILTDDDSVEKWADEIVTLAKDEKRLDAMSKEAILKTEEFAIDKIIAEWRALIEDVVKDKKTDWYE